MECRGALTAYSDVVDPGFLDKNCPLRFELCLCLLADDAGVAAQRADNNNTHAYSNAPDPASSWHSDLT